MILFTLTNIFTSMLTITLYFAINSFYSNVIFSAAYFYFYFTLKFLIHIQSWAIHIRWIELLNNDGRLEAPWMQGFLSAFSALQYMAGTQIFVQWNDEMWSFPLLINIILKELTFLWMLFHMFFNYNIAFNLLYVLQEN